MKRRISLILVLLMLTVLVLTCFTGCTPATEQAMLTLTNAGGAGTLTTTVLILLGGAAENDAYVKNVQKIAETLDEKVDALTRTKDLYQVSYTGKVGDHETVSMSFSFTDINDYNRKCLRLYNSISDGMRNNVKRTESYPMASWDLTDNGDGTYNATFTQDAAIFSMVNQWAYDWLMDHDVQDAWDYTGDGNAVQYNPFGDYTFIDSSDATVILTVGDKRQTMAAYKGMASQTVSLTGKVSGTPVTVDKTVTDEDLIVSEPVAEETRSYPALDAETQKVFDELCDISLDLPADRKIKVACVGDSITHGTEGESRTYPSYPWFLQQILGDGYEVGNFGVGGTRLMHSGGVTAAYVESAKYQPSLDFEPDVVIIMLGTNDSAAHAFKRFDTHFATDYQELINTYKNLPSSPKVIVATSPYAPAMSGTSDAVINDYIIPYERELFTKMDNVDGVVDVGAWSDGRYYLYFDNVHYSAEGYYSLALHYAKEIFGLGNGYRTVTVNAVPGAIVTLERPVQDGNVFQQSVVADEKGVAVCYEQDGNYTITVRATDYARYTGSITVTGDCTVDCTMVPGDYNVALYRPVTASSVDNSGYTAEMVNDEECATNWHPIESDSVGGWLLFDLGDIKELHGLRLSSRFQSYASAYTVEVSDDGETFTRVADLTDTRNRFVNDHLEEHYFTSTYGRYVRVTFLKRGDSFNYEIFDLQLLSNEQRTVSEREKEILAKREEQEKDDTGTDGEKNRKPLCPWIAGGVAALAAVAGVVIASRKKKK